MFSSRAPISFGANPPRPNFSLRVTTTQTLREKQTASGLIQLPLEVIYAMADY